MNFGLSVDGLCREAAKHHGRRQPIFGGARLPFDPMMSTKLLACSMPKSSYTGACAEPGYVVWPRITAPPDRLTPPILEAKPDVAVNARSLGSARQLASQD
jgi:hypothetical protein